MKVKIIMQVEMEAEIEDKFLEENPVEPWHHTLSKIELTEEGEKEVAKRYSDITRIEELDTGKIIAER